MEQLNTWADKVHILSAGLLCCQRISRRSRQAEPKVFTIMCATHLLYSLSRPSITLLSLSTQDRCRAHASLPGERAGRADGRKAGWARGALLAAHRTYVS